MAIEFRGHHITMFCKMLQTKPEAYADAVRYIQQKTGKHPDQIDPMGWYPAALFSGILDALVKHSSPILARAAFKLMGAQIYPALKAHGVIPPDVNTVNKMFHFEATGFTKNFRGVGLTPRKIIKETANEFVVQADMPPELVSDLQEGVFQGILNLCKVTGTVKLENKDGHSIYHMQWK